MVVITLLVTRAVVSIKHIHSWRWSRRSYRWRMEVWIHPIISLCHMNKLMAVLRSMMVYLSWYQRIRNIRRWVRV